MMPSPAESVAAAIKNGLDSIHYIHSKLLEPLELLHTVDSSVARAGRKGGAITSTEARSTTASRRSAPPTQSDACCTLTATSIMSIACASCAHERNCLTQGLIN
jgi:hypothetical protein